MERKITKKYSNGEVTIVWQPHLCIHSGICAKGLPGVFRPNERPWIITEAAKTDALVNQVKNCPSGALSFFMNDEINAEAENMETKVEVLPNGPLLIYGTLKVTDKNGKTETKNKTTAFCRCGHSQNKPYCDGSHIKADFQD